MPSRSRTMRRHSGTDFCAFMAAGGERFTYIPCLNDHPDHVIFLADLVERELGGWVDGARTRAARDAEDHVTA